MQGRWWHVAPACQSTLLTFMSGKIAPQNDEQAQHGEHHHGHDAANHSVIHRPYRAFFTCSRICWNQKRNRDVELITGHQRPWPHYLQGQKITFFFSGGASENNPDGSSYSGRTDWPVQCWIDLFSPQGNFIISSTGALMQVERA